MVHLKLIVKGVKFRFFIFFTLEYPFAVASFVKKIILLPLNCFCNFVKNQLALLMWAYF